MTTQSAAMLLQTTINKANYIAKSKASISTTGSVTAKLSQKVLFPLTNGTTDISKNALHFMLYAINFVAKDGRIYLSLEQIKKALLFQNKTLVRVIAELEELGLLSKQNHFFYSHFHVLSGERKSDEMYVRNLSVFTSPTVLNLKKNELRFFLYIASRGLINEVFKRSAIETLYSNATHKGVNYIDSYQTLSDILNTLISLGLIDVTIENQIFNKDNAISFLPNFHAYCGYKENIRKQRMSKHKDKTHVIGFRINPSLYTKDNIRSNESARREIEYFADENCFFHSHMRPQTIPTFIKSVQDVLYERFGLVGYELYREALVGYFAKEGDNVIYHDLYADEKSSKAINTMVDFFLLPAIKKLIVTCVTNPNLKDSKVTYFKQADNLLNLVDYYIEKGSDNHIVLLEEALEAANVSINELVKIVPISNPNENSWLLLQTKTAHIYQTIRFRENELTLSCQKQIVREWAKDGLLSQKSKLDAAVNTLKAKVIFLEPNKLLNDSANNNESVTVNNIQTEKNVTNSAKIPPYDKVNKNLELIKLLKDNPNWSNW